MALLIVTLGTALFVGVHLVPVMPEWRAALVGSIGEGPYKAIFALLSLAGLIGAIVAYRFTPHVALWASPAAAQGGERARAARRGMAVRGRQGGALVQAHRAPSDALGHRTVRQSLICW